VRRQPVAFVALFFALGGGAMAAGQFLRSTDTITKGDLAGSTYGDPLIASGAVTNDKLANPSLTLNSGTGLTGGGSVALGGNTTLGVADGGIGTSQLADGSVTTGKFASGAQAPDSAELGGADPTAYGAVLTGRVKGLATGAFSSDLGAVSGISTAVGGGANDMLSPDHALYIRDFTVHLTAAPGSGASRLIGVFVGIGAAPCTIQDTNTSCTIRGPMLVPADSTIGISDVTITGAAAADALFGFRLTNS
jgi:hypothetical protein